MNNKQIEWIKLAQSAMIASMDARLTSEERQNRALGLLYHLSTLPPPLQSGTQEKKRVVNYATT